MKKFAFLACFLFLIIGQIAAQQIPQPLILQDVYPQNLFDANYTNQLFRNRFVQVDTGSDTVFYFVDQYGHRGLMIEGATGGTGGTVDTASPLQGDGSVMDPVTFIDGTVSGQYLSWNGSAWALTAAPTSTNIYNANGSLTGNRTLTGAGFSLTETGLSTKTESGTGVNTRSVSGTASIIDTQTGTGDIELITAGGEIFVTANQNVEVLSALGNVFIDANEGFAVTWDDNGSAIFTDNSTTLLGAEYGADYPLTRGNARSLLDAGNVKILIRDSLNTHPTLYNANGTLAANRVVAGNAKSLTYSGLLSHAETSTGNNTTTTTAGGNILEFADGGIEMEAGTSWSATSFGSISLNATEMNQVSAGAWDVQADGSVNITSSTSSITIQSDAGSATIDAATAINIQTGGAITETGTEVSIEASAGGVDINADTDVSVQATNGSYFQFTGVGFEMEFGTLGGAASAIITDGSTTKTGLEYADDYGATLRGNAGSLLDAQNVKVLIRDTSAVHVQSGRYTPTRSGETNLDGNVTPSVAMWSRTNNMVTVSGRVTYDPTTTSTATAFQLTLPIASNLAAVQDANGTGHCGTALGESMQVSGNSGSDTMQFTWICATTASSTLSYIVQYIIQ